MKKINYEDKNKFDLTTLIFQKTLFQNKIALITGGGTGIGKQVVIELCKHGIFGIIICGRRTQPLEETEKLIKKYFPKVKFYWESCDIRKYEMITKFIERSLKIFKTIDFLVNNAGGQFPSPALNISPNGFQAVVNNNLMGTWNFTHAVTSKVFVPQGKSRSAIVNVIAQIKRGFPLMVHTGAARAGVENMTKTLAVEWAPYKINVNCVAPGTIKSTGTLNTKRYPKQFLTNAREATPLKRLGTCMEVAQLITYLLSENASFITGQSFYIDGGQSLFGDSIDPHKFAKPLKSKL